MALTERFERLYEPEPNSGCWLWKGATACGYGYFRHRPAHRFAYELYRGPIPEGLQLDHLCRVRSCVNPSHLEAVTQGVNLHRGETIAARNAAKTHCPKGHEYTPMPRKLGVFRYCLVCQADWRRAHNNSKLSSQGGA